MQLSVLVSANYVVQVRMISYIHPSNTRSDGQCCDSEPGNGLCSGGERCDTYFIYCLMPRASTAIGCSNATSGFTLVSSVSPDGADIDFSQPTVLGLPNPFLLTGISTAWEVMITVLLYFIISCYCRVLSFTYKLLILITIHQMMLLQGIALN